MEKYAIKDCTDLHGLTAIGRIGIIKRSGDEWATFTKEFTAGEIPDFAAVRMDARGVCGIFINGKHLEGNTGRHCNRITYAECTSMLKPGKNEIKLVLGGHYYQGIHARNTQRSGAQFSFAAAELEMEKNGRRETVVTGEEWICCSDDGQSKPVCYSEVTESEYKRFWLSAALIPEPRSAEIPNAVAEVAGEGYLEYARTPWQCFAYPQKTVSTNMDEANGKLTSKEAASSVVYDFGKLYVGYLQIVCTAQQTGTVTLYFDYSEDAEDVALTNRFVNGIKKLSVRKPLKAGENTVFLIRRRACRFLRVDFDCPVVLDSVCFKLSMTPSVQTGWFHCNEAIFNKMWEVGKYTLHVNKHQEYESCPRSEMKYFSGDGIVDALIDYYAFGDPSVTISSLSLTEPGVCGGLVPDKYARNWALTDYPAWRIISAYNQYRYFGDRYFVEQYFDELAGCMDWLTERMNRAGLIYQYPIYMDIFYTESDSVEYTCSFDRLGEKPLINALLYQSLLCMAEFAQIVGDERASFWADLAQKVCKAFNDRLWCEEKQAYLDTYDTSYIPQDGNALALLFGLAQGERAEALLDTLRKKLWTPYGATILSEPVEHTRGGSKTLSPAMNMYEAEARFLHSQSKSALELMENCWGTMLRKGAETFWEFAPANGEDRWPVPSHAWSGGCTYLLSAYVLGIRPETAGYETLHFEPYGGFDAFEGVVPTTKGLIAVRSRTENGKRSYVLAVPKGMKVKSYLQAGDSLQIREYDA